MINNDCTKQLLEMKDKIKIFDALDDDEVKVILKDIVFKKYSKNEIIFNQGENDNEYIYYIMSGEVSISITDNNVSKTVAVLKKDAIIGEMKPMINGVRTATCTSGLTGAVLIGFIIDHECTGTNTMAYLKYYKNLVQILAKKLQDTNCLFYAK